MGKKLFMHMITKWQCEMKLSFSFENNDIDEDNSLNKKFICCPMSIYEGPC